MYSTRWAPCLRGWPLFAGRLTSQLAHLCLVHLGKNEFWRDWHAEDVFGHHIIHMTALVAVNHQKPRLFGFRAFFAFLGNDV